ncbi:MAG: hypothetical protein COA52_01365 [Hyphomicrobiales bacterium]|nr:MAG: hypothetical protein COA52_00275 [Hyphomicrobiales bacterium]PCJ96881.1 MAG: hypothetical protein COA52_01365 [Hyphomicrobiales bacterium]
MSDKLKVIDEPVNVYGEEIFDGCFVPDPELIFLNDGLPWDMPWVDDIKDMHNHYQIPEKVKEFDKEKLEALLKFRIAFLEEELNEMKDSESADDVVDALIDLVVVAIGTLDLFEVNAQKAWSAVHKANMSKEVGIKASRPNPLGLPDLIKPEGWEAPSHRDNIGRLGEIFD